MNKDIPFWVSVLYLVMAVTWLLSHMAQSRAEPQGRLQYSMRDVFNCILNGIFVFPGGKGEKQDN